MTLSFPEIRALILSYQNISNLEEKFTHYRSLYRLDLSNNIITQLAGEYFLELKSLRLVYARSSIHSDPKS